MGCTASHRPLIDTQNSQPILTPSKRLSTLSIIEKPPYLNFTLKLLPYNTEIERVSSLSIEIAKYSLQNKPPFIYTLLDLFYNAPEDLNYEEKLLFKVQENLSKERMILKMIAFQDYHDSSFKAAIYQISILQSLKSKGLIRLRDFFINDFGLNRKKFLILLFEEADFTLADLLLYRKGIKNAWKEEELLRIMKDFAEIGEDLEKAQVCHRDIRPENFWYNSKESRWKLANFESARVYEAKENPSFSHDLMLNSFRGKPEFLAPEIRSLYEAPGAKEKGVEIFDAYMNDIYGFGLVFLMLVQCDNQIDPNLRDQAEVLEPWDDRLSIEIVCKMMNGNVKRRPFYSNIREILLLKEEKGKVLRDRKIELAIYSDLKGQMDREESLQLKILKQEKYAHAYFKILQAEDALNQFDELLTFFEAHNDEENRANTLKEIGEFSILLGNSAKASELFKESLSIYLLLGAAAKKAGNFHKAVVLYEKALGLAGVLYGTNEPSFVQVLEQCGNAYRLDGRFEEAKTCQEKALGILIKQKGEGSIEVARLLNNLANTFAGLKQFDTAEELLHNSIRVLREQCVKESPNLLAMALCNLGEIYRHKKLLLEAKTAIEEALIIKEKIFGAGASLDLASALDNLGNVYYDLGEFGKAKKLYEKSLIMKESQLGEFCIEIAISLNNLGNSCRCLKELKIAEGYYKKGIQIYKTQTKEKHPRYAATVGNLGLVYKDMGKKDEAKKLLKEACKILFDNNQKEEDSDYHFFRKELDLLK